jgi:hypothetical protein
MGSHFSASQSASSFLSSSEVAMTVDHIMALIIPEDESKRVPGGPLVSPTKIKGVGNFVADLPEYDGYPRLRRYSKISADDACRKLRAALLERHHVPSIVKVTVADRNDLARMLREREAQKSEIPILQAWTLGNRILTAQAAHGWENDPYESARLDGERYKTKLGPAVARFLASIPDPVVKPLRPGNNQKQTIRPIMDDLVAALGADTNVMDLIRHPERLDEFLKLKIQQEIACPPIHWKHQHLKPTTRK